MASMTACWSYWFLTTLTFIHAFSSCSRRSYRPIDNCSLAESRDYSIPVLDPVRAGSVTHRKLVSSRTHEVITVAVDPPVFEIPEFLSSSECEALIESAQRNGLKNATLMGAKGNLDGGKQIGRVGETTFLMNSQFLHIRERVASLIQLPLDLVQASEGYQIAHYWPGGFYRSHWDSMWEWTNSSQKPCCHQIQPPHSTDRCSPCRYLTLLIYLNDVEEGGETGFSDAQVHGEPTTNYTYENLRHLKDAINSRPAKCRSSEVVVQPKTGKAVLWYNHFRDDKTGWLGPLNPRSVHGGCDVIRGEKWVANVWINIPRYEDRNNPSVFEDGNRWE